MLEIIAKAAVYLWCLYSAYSYRGSNSERSSDLRPRPRYVFNMGS